MKRRRKVDQFQTDFGVPDAAQKRIGNAVWTGIERVRTSTSLAPVVRVRAYMMAGKNKHPVATNLPVASFGWTTGSRMTIGINPKYLSSWRFRRGLIGTAIHEYTHYLRFSNKAIHGSTRTVLDGLLEEGIAIYLETVLNAAPIYIDHRLVSEKMMRFYWDRLSNVLRLPEKSVPTVLKNTVYRTIYYRLGLGIVSQFMNDHPKFTLKQLVGLPRRRLVTYTRRIYEPMV